MRDGTIDCYDLSRGLVSPYRIPNLWWEEEEILRKSGVPDAPSRRHVPVVVQISTHPKQLHQLLIAYEGGIVLLDLKTKTVLHTYQLRLLPGAPGAGPPAGGGPGGDPMAMIWTERSSPVTCIAWRPDGEVFAAGHEDGCLSFWHVKDDGKPLLVRTMDRIDVDKPQMMDPSSSAYSAWADQKEPIFKLAWSGFPEKGWLEYAREGVKSAQERAAAAKSPHLGFSSPSAIPLTAEEQAALDKQARDKAAGIASADSQQVGTVLTVLGGASIARDPPGVVCLHFPAFEPRRNSSLWGGGASSSASTAALSADMRAALRASLDPTRESRYHTQSTVEDILLMPRNNPHYGMAYDPTSIITLLAADPSLPSLPPPAASRALKCFPFPPPRRQRTRGASTSSALGQRYHPTTLPPGATWQHPMAPRELQLPLPLTFAGSGAIVGASMETVSIHAYRKLGGKCAEPAGSHLHAGEAGAVPGAAVTQSADDVHEQLELRGGKAYPIVSNDPTMAPERLAKKSEYRILITWHLDGTVRFHDASPHLMLHTPAGAAEAELSQQQQQQQPQQSSLFGSAVGGTTAAPSSAERLLEHSCPAPLPHLTISTRDTVFHPAMSGHPSIERLRANQNMISITNVQLASEVLEVAITLRSGRILYHKFGFARASETDAINDEVALELEHDRAAAEAATSDAMHGFHHQHRPPRTSVSSGSHLPAPGENEQEARLDNAMSDALQSLDMSGSNPQLNAPSGNGGSRPESRLSMDRTGNASPTIRPPRPPRDPNRPRGASSLPGSPNVPASARHERVSTGASQLSVPPHSPAPQLMLPPASAFPQPRILPARELTDLAHIATWHTDGFKPMLLIDLNRGEISSTAVSDIGFLAIACDMALAVVNLRVPDLLIRDAFGDMPESPEQTREERKAAEAESKSVIRHLHIGILRMASDSRLAPRVLVSRENGLLSVWTLSESLGEWLAIRTSAKKLESTANTQQIITTDIHGAPSRSTGVELQRSQREQEHGGPSDIDASRCSIGVFLTRGGMNVRYGVDGSTIAKVEMTERILGAQIVERGAERFLLVVTSPSIFAYSLPHLDLLDRKQR